MEYADYNVEFAHLYLAPSAAPIGPEQLESVRRTMPVVESLRNQGKTLALSLLVDECHGGSPVDDLGALAEGLAGAGLGPQFIMPESALTRVADTLIDLLPPKYLYETSTGLFLSTLTRDPLLWASAHAGSERAFLESLLAQHLAMQESGAGGEETSRRNTTIVWLKSVEEGSSRHSCALLTACWHLMRLGIPPFDKAADALHRRGWPILRAATRNRVAN